MPNGGFDPLPEDDAFFGLAQEARVPLAVHIGSFLRDNPNSQWPGIEERRYLASAGSSKAGAHTLPYRSELSSGVYLLQLSTPEGTRSTKLGLVR